MIKLSKEQISTAEELHKKAVIVDGHSDWSIELARWRLQGDSHVFENKHIPELNAGGVSAEVFTIGGDEQLGPLWGPDPKKNLEMLDIIHRETAESEGGILLGTKADDAIKAKTSGKKAIFLAMEGLRAIQESLVYLRTYWRLGVRVVGLTWNARNAVADGCGEKKPSGLSNFGRDVVAEIQRLDMLIDVSHLSEASFKDLTEVTNRTIIASHSNARALCDHPRNLRDEQIHEIAERNGTIGINFTPHFIDKRNPALETLLDHVDYIAKLVGSEYIALGPDYVHYCMDYLREEAQKLEKAGIHIDTEMKFPEEVRDLSKLSNFTKGLVARGYSEKEIRGILGENLLGVYRRVFR